MWGNETNHSVSMGPISRQLFLRISINRWQTSLLWNNLREDCSPNGPKRGWVRSCFWAYSNTPVLGYVESSTQLQCQYFWSQNNILWITNILGISYFESFLFFATIYHQMTSLKKFFSRYQHLTICLAVQVWHCLYNTYSLRLILFQDYERIDIPESRSSLDSLLWGIV